MSGYFTTSEPCVLHDYHRPLSVVNELHHPFPQEWQRELWGEVRDDRRVSICATGHNNVHAALSWHAAYGEWPRWCVGNTRDLCELALFRLAEAQAGTA